MEKTRGTKGNLVLPSYDTFECENETCVFDRDCLARLFQVVVVVMVTLALGLMGNERIRAVW